jgi:hypothetical protein
MSSGDDERVSCRLRVSSGMLQEAMSFNEAES